ncbi:MAG TPA: DUF3231 family protein [Spirochaetia bacterium]|nr:DUF3231 family protein [Spirochaetia bacterium]
MNLFQIANILPKKKQPLDWGEANALWSVARNKLIGLSTLEIYLDQAEDNELKLLLDMGIKKLAVPNIERIFKLLQEEGLEVPGMPGRISLQTIGKNTGKAKFLLDSEIAVSIKEILRLATYLTLRGIEVSYRDDVLDLFLNIFQADFNAFKDIVAMQKSKNWQMQSPVIYTEKNVNTNKKMEWSEGVGFWSIARDKLVKLTALEAYLPQTTDPELKLFVEALINEAVRPIIERIIGLLHEEGHGAPSIPGRGSLHVTAKETGDCNWLSNADIAVLVREHLRLVLYVDFEALNDTFRSDLIDLAWDIFTKDAQRFREIIDLQRKKNWLLASPTVKPSNRQAVN